MFGRQGKHSVDHNIPFDDRVAAIIRSHGPEILQRDHPAVPRIARGFSRAHRLSDITIRVVFEQTELYRVVYRAVHIRHQLIAPITVPTGFGGFTVNRDGRDFSDLEVALIARFVRHVDRAYATDKLIGERRPSEDTQAAFNERLARRRVTRRESEVLYWMREGKRDAEIAFILSISARTVETHLASAYRKLGVDGRTAALAELRRTG